MLVTLKNEERIAWYEMYKAVPAREVGSCRVTLSEILTLRANILDFTLLGACACYA